MLLEAVEEVSELHAVSGAAVLGLDKAPGQILFEPLQIHDLLLEGILHDQSIDADLARLPDSVRAVDGLEIFHGVPVMLSEEHSVSTGQSEAEPTYLGRQNEHANGLVAVETIHDLETLLGTVLGEELLVFDLESGEHLVNDELKHGAHLTEDESAMGSRDLCAKRLFSHLHELSTFFSLWFMRLTMLNDLALSEHLHQAKQLA